MQILLPLKFSAQTHLAPITTTAFCMPWRHNETAKTDERRFATLSKGM